MPKAPQAEKHLNIKKMKRKKSRGKEKVIPSRLSTFLLLQLFQQSSNAESKNNLMEDLVRELRNEMTVFYPRELRNKYPTFSARTF